MRPPAGVSWLGDLFSGLLGMVITGGVAAWSKFRDTARDHDAEIETRLRNAESELSAIRATLNERKKP